MLLQDEDGSFEVGTNFLAKFSYCFRYTYNLQAALAEAIETIPNQWGKVGERNLQWQKLIFALFK